MKQLFLIAVLFSSVSLYAQNLAESKLQTRGKNTHSGYGALTTNYSKFNGENAMFVGAYGGWLINHKLMLGLAGQYLVTQHDGFGFNTETNKENELKMGYGGLMVEYTFFEKRKIHATANSIIGFGVITNGSDGGYDPETGESWRSVDESGFLAFHPSVNVELDVTKWFRISAGGGYRVIASSNVKGLSDSDLSSPTANVTLKFGVF